MAGPFPGMTIRVRENRQTLLNRLLGVDEGLTIEIRDFDLVPLGRPGA